MATRKRSSTQSRLLKRAVKAGRSAFRRAEKQVPPDVRRQIERSIKDGQKTVEGALKQLRTRLDRTARQADLEAALKRLDGLTKQVQQLARAATSGAAAPRRAARRPSRVTKKRVTPKAAAAPKSPPRPAPKAAPRRRSMRTRTIVTPAAVETPPMVITDPEPREPSG
jgi:polyhydroxyalkanoate synthesis regulator phasin